MYFQNTLSTRLHKPISGLDLNFEPMPLGSRKSGLLSSPTMQNQHVSPIMNYEYMHARYQGMQENNFVMHRSPDKTKKMITIKTKLGTMEIPKKKQLSENYLNKFNQLAKLYGQPRAPTPTKAPISSISAINRPKPIHNQRIMEAAEEEEPFTKETIESMMQNDFGPFITDKIPGIKMPYSGLDLKKRNLTESNITVSNLRASPKTDTLNSTPRRFNSIGSKNSISSVDRKVGNASPFMNQGHKMLNRQMVVPRTNVRDLAMEKHNSEDIARKSGNLIRKPGSYTFNSNRKGNKSIEIGGLMSGGVVGSLSSTAREIGKVNNMYGSGNKGSYSVRNTTSTKGNYTKISEIFRENIPVSSDGMRSIEVGSANKLEGSDMMRYRYNASVQEAKSSRFMTNYSANENKAGSSTNSTRNYQANSARNNYVGVSNSNKLTKIDRLTESPVRNQNYNRPVINRRPLNNDSYKGNNVVKKISNQQNKPFTLPTEKTSNTKENKDDLRLNLGTGDTPISKENDAGSLKLEDFHRGTQDFLQNMVTTTTQGDNSVKSNNTNGTTRHKQMLIERIDVQASEFIVKDVPHVNLNSTPKGFNNQSISSFKKAKASNRSDLSDNRSPRVNILEDISPRISPIRARNDSSVERLTKNQRYKKFMNSNIGEKFDEIAKALRKKKRTKSVKFTDN